LLIILLMKALLLIAGALLLAGCCGQFVEEGFGELSTCVSKCSEVCDAVKNNSVDLDGYTQIGLEKQSGSMSISCECYCS
jgi:hypothetical protein